MSASTSDLQDAAHRLMTAETLADFNQRFMDWREAAECPEAVLWLCDGDANSLYEAFPLAETQTADRPIPDGMAEFSPDDIPLILDGLLIGTLTVDVGAQAVVLPAVSTLAASVYAQAHSTRISSENSHIKAQLAGLTAAGQLLRHLDLDTLLVKVLETVMSGVSAQVGALLITDDDGILKTRVAWGMREEHVGAIKCKDGVSVVQSVMTSGQPILVSKNINKELDTKGLEAELTGLLALPLGVGARRQGVVLLANPARAFDASQQRLAETVCGMAAIAIDNATLVRSAVDQQRLQSEMDLARQVQIGMYPKESLIHESFEIVGLARPCTETGGDYYTFVERAGRLLAMIGDVSGHGLGAALYTTTAHAVLHQQLRSDAGAGSAMRVLNESLHHGKSGRFMTAAIVDINPETKSFTYHSAGHNPLLWVHDGELVWLESTAMPLGIMPENPSEAPPEQVFSSGDMLILYTDGITEAAKVGGDLFGEPALAEAVLANMDKGASGVIDGVMKVLDAFTVGEPVNDDITMVVVAIK